MIAENSQSLYRPGSYQTSTGQQVGPRLHVDQVFGRFRVIVVERRLHGKRAADVCCECGTRKRVRHEHLLSGDIKSCDCLRAERLDTWRRLREDDDAKAATALSQTAERLPESDLLRVTLGRLNP